MRAAAFYYLIRVVLQVHARLCGTPACSLPMILADPMRGAGYGNRPTIFSVVINSISTKKVIRFNFHGAGQKVYAKNIRY